MRVLVAVDGSECSGAALDAVASRLWPRGSVAKVVAVADLAFSDSPAFGLFVPEFYGDLTEMGARSALAALEGARAALARRVDRDLAVETEVLSGPPAESIVREAERWRADLVIVGSHGRGPVGRLVLGSVSAAVLEHAPCPVEIVRAQAAARVG